MVCLFMSDLWTKFYRGFFMNAHSFIAKVQKVINGVSRQTQKPFRMLQLVAMGLGAFKVFPPKDSNHQEGDEVVVSVTLHADHDGNLTARPVIEVK